LVVSSWALIFLSAPMMAAYGHVHRVPPVFYAEVALLYLPFVVLPGLLGSWSIMLLVRVLPRRGVKKALLVIAAGLVLLLLFGLKPIRETEAMSPHDVLSFEQLLRHTRISLSPWLPSAWLAKSVLAWGEGLGTQGAFYFLVLLSNALFGLLLGFEVVGRMFYESWTRALSSRAERFQRASEEKKLRVRHPGLLERALRALLPDATPTAALVLKDVRLFWRDPTQWIQFMIFFGLLCIYVLNLRNVAFDFSSAFWTTMVSYLNLTASSLTLSTLTTRFVFPQFSLEGRRIWILGLAPFGMQHVVLQKFWLSCLTAMAITVSLMVASSLVLNLAWSKIAFFALAIALMSATLSGLAVGLGALYPNFKEDNPSKIVSGFGGTLCLVVSFVYISLFVSLLAIPDLRHVTRIPFIIPDAAALTIAVLLSFGILAVPMGAALKRVKNLEI
jgi:ABC-2 type transport system permease protein